MSASLLEENIEDIADDSAVCDLSTTGLSIKDLIVKSDISNFVARNQSTEDKDLRRDLLLQYISETEIWANIKMNENLELFAYEIQDILGEISYDELVKFLRLKNYDKLINVIDKETNKYGLTKIATDTVDNRLNLLYDLYCIKPDLDTLVSTIDRINMDGYDYKIVSDTINQIFKLYNDDDEIFTISNLSDLCVNVFRKNKVVHFINKLPVNRLSVVSKGYLQRSVNDTMRGDVDFTGLYELKYNNLCLPTAIQKIDDIELQKYITIWACLNNIRHKSLVKTLNLYTKNINEELRETLFQICVKNYISIFEKHILISVKSDKHSSNDIRRSMVKALDSLENICTKLLEGVELEVQESGVVGKFDNSWLTEFLEDLKAKKNIDNNHKNSTQNKSKLELNTVIKERMKNRIDSNNLEITKIIKRVRDMINGITEFNTQELYKSAYDKILEIKSKTKILEELIVNEGFVNERQNPTKETYTDVTAIINYGRFSVKTSNRNPVYNFKPKITFTTKRTKSYANIKYI